MNALKPATIFVNHPDPLALHGLSLLIEGYVAEHRIAASTVTGTTGDSIRARIGRDTCYFIHETCLGREGAKAYVRRLRAEQRHAKICLMVEHRAILMNEDIMTIGTNALVCSSCTVGDIGQAIDAVFQGSVFFSPRIATLMQGNYSLADRLRDRYGLTDRELDVIQLVGAGCSSKEAARELKISHRTVETHRQSILQKCNLKSSFMIAHLLRDHTEALSA